jgi:sarcosine oxidase subunit beta
VSVHAGDVDAIASVAVIGAGVTGLSIALHLAEGGLEPLVLDRAGIGAGASGVQPGGVRQQWTTRLTCELARESLAFYRDLGSRLGTRAGSEFDACGYVFVAHSPERLDALRAAVAVQHEAGVPSRLLTPAELADVVPGIVVDGLAGAAYCEEDGYLDRPQGAVEAFAEAAFARGARLRIGEVQRIRPDGRGFRLYLRDGCVLAEAVVVASGWEAPALLEEIAPGLPIERERRHLFYSEPIREPLLRPLVVAPERRFAVKQLADGRILAGDLGARGESSLGRDAWRRHVGAVIEELLPALSYASLPLLVSGDYDVTPDHQPVVGPVAGDERLIVAAGFSGHGFMLAPAIGRRVAGALVDGAIDPALAAFSPDRFAGGRLQKELQTV